MTTTMRDAAVAAPSPEAIRLQLERILASEAFDASERNHGFLQYVVEETLAGRAIFIKGYTVACRVFHRDVDFDPQLDPVVRIEASRLRRSLERYYLTAGRSDPILVELPKGGYVPRFAVNPETLVVPVGPAAPMAPQSAAPLVPAIRLQPLTSCSGEPADDAMAFGVGEEVALRLIRCEELAVEAATSDRTFCCREREPRIRVALEGSLRPVGSRLRVSLRLRDVESDTFLWADSLDCDASATDAAALHEQIADGIVTRIAGSHGVLARVFADRIACGMLPHPDVSNWIIQFHAYRRQATAASHAAARAGLEQAVRRHEGTPLAWAYLAIVHIDEHRLGLNRRTGLPTALARALAAAERAVALAGQSAVARGALSLVYHHLQRYEESCAMAREALARNPGSPDEIVLQAIKWLASHGHWDEAAPPLRHSVSVHPDQWMADHPLLATAPTRRVEPHGLDRRPSTAVPARPFAGTSRRHAHETV